MFNVKRPLFVRSTIFYNCIIVVLTNVHNKYHTILSGPAIRSKSPLGKANSTAGKKFPSGDILIVYTTYSFVQNKCSNL